MPIAKNKGPLLQSISVGGIADFPQEFIAQVDLITEVQHVPVDVLPDTITLLNLLVDSKVEQDRTDERKKTNIRFSDNPWIDDDGNPDPTGALHSQVKLDSGLVADIAHTLVPSGTDLLVDSLTESANQKNLGNGWLDQTVVEAPELWPHQIYGRERGVVTPQDFRALLQEQSFTGTQDGQATPPPVLTAGVVSVTDENVDVFHHRESVRLIDLLDLPAVNLNSRTNRFKQVETVARWLLDENTTPTTPTSVRDTTFTKLGDGTALEERIFTDNLFDQHVYSREKPDISPSWARALLSEFEESYFEEGIANDPDPLDPGVHLERQQQEDEFNRRITRRSRDLFDLPVQRVGYRTNRFKQVETVTDILEDDGTTPASPTALRDVTFEILGDGSATEQHVDLDSLFTAQVYEESRPEVWPARFQALIPLSTDRHRETGIATLPTLITGDVRKSEQQEDDFNKQVETTRRDLPGLPTDLLYGQRYEETFDLVVPYSEWIDAAGANLGDARKVVTPQGDGTEQVEQLDFTSVAAALDAYSLVFPGTTNLNSKLPDVLSDLASVFEVNSGNGTYSETGSGYWNIRGSYALSIRGSGNASAAVVSDANFLLLPPFKPSAPTTRVVFFLPNPVVSGDVLTKLTAILGGSVSNWPNFDPTPVTVVCTSRKVSVRAEANQHTQSGGSGIVSEDGDPCSDFDCVTCDASSTTGTGVSTEVGITIKTIRIPPCLHGAISLHDNQDEVATAQAYAFDGSSFGSCVPPEYGPADTGVITLTATGTVDSDASATSLTSYPSGMYLMDTSAQPYKYGYALIHAEVVTL